ncbi:hypothetical protein GH714_023292 [Hevea brasiliensis]|uniref:Probable magnesium transporter n=1 Tax=Hevea brasiliensis TaxID=3981 RepID=A0A6A6LA48_HEVBR|nr:hypothetical protein GH714_023292 [Hevea brasiliensis]
MFPKWRRHDTHMTYFGAMSEKIKNGNDRCCEVRAMADSDKGMSSDNIKGLVLALSSSLFIGASFIVKKKGLKKAGASGLRAGAGGYSYLYEPLWWIGMITSNAALAHVILREKLHIFGILGCALCVVGSTTIVLHAPQEREIDLSRKCGNLHTEPAFLFYATFVIGAVFIIIVRVIPTMMVVIVVVVVIDDCQGDIVVLVAAISGSNGENLLLAATEL